MSQDTGHGAMLPTDGPGARQGRLWPLMVIVGAIGVAIRVAVFCEALHRLPFFAVAPDWLDMGTYDAWARQIASGDWLGRAQGAFYQNALYPYLLAIAYLVAGPGNIVAGIVMNGLFGVAAAVCVAGLGRRLFGWWPGLVAGLFTALSGSQLSAELLLLPDSLLPVFFLGALWLVVSNVKRQEVDAPRSAWGWLLPGLLLGLATVGRGSNLLVAAALCAWLLLGGARRHRRRLIVAAVVIGGGVWLVVAPLVLRNGVMFGAWTVSTNGPPTLYLSNAPGATGYFSYPRRYELVRRMALASDKPGKVWLGELRRELAEDPAALARVMARKAQLLLNSFDAPDNGNYYFTRRYAASLRFLTFGPLLIYTIGAVGLVLTWPRRRDLVPLYVTILSLAATLLVFHVAGRFKLPILSLLGVLGAGGLASAWKAFRERRWRTLLAAALIAAVGTLAFWPRLPLGVAAPGRLPTLRPQEFINHSTALLQQGRMPRAVAMMKDAAALFPDDPRFCERLAGIALRDGRFEHALRYVDAAMRNGHRTEPLLRRRVEALAALGRIDEGRQALAELLAAYPDSPVSPLAVRQLGNPGASVR
jgi:4-amino-4-deoxy-L-arabinose transferase-like glycosyltransferase